MYKDRKLCIATMHKKEEVIAPVLEKELGAICLTCAELNTDLLGTFSGEIERLGTPLETARQKCLTAMQFSGLDLAVSSEGSFGPHPAIGFVPCDEELLLFYDQLNNLEIFVREISLKTNFAGEELTDLSALKKFAVRSLFPSHALIVKDMSGNVIEKGITDWQALERSFYKAKAVSQQVKIETDMRAHFNPTRMAVIRACAEKLAAAVKSGCPACNLPGFTVSEAEPGLPCKLCHLPTRSTLKHISVCKGCGYKQETIYPHLKKFEDPAHCDFCNP